MTKQSQQTSDSMTQAQEFRLPNLPLEVLRRLQITYLVVCVPSSSRGNMSSTNTLRPIAETSHAPIQHATRDFIGLEMLNATSPPATAPKKRKTNTFANTIAAPTLLKDFLETTISSDMFGYSMEEGHAAARVALWT